MMPREDEDVPVIGAYASEVRLDPVVDFMKSRDIPGADIVDSVSKEVTESPIEEVLKEDNKALRYNEGKPKFSLISLIALIPMIRVLMYGAKKYTTHNPDGSVKSTGANNWKKGLKKSEVLDSLQRHIAALLEGEENDPESGLPHIGHIQCNTMFLGHPSLIDDMKGVQ